MVGLKSTTEPLEACMSRTASWRINCSASCGSRVEWILLLTWYSELNRS